MIDLSIIIVSWNTRELLLRCVKSVVESDPEISREMIVVDNGSWDGSIHEVEKAFPFVHLVGNEKNLGFAKAVNQGLRKASGRYILLLNPDTEVKNGAIHELLSFMESHSRTGVAGAQLLNSDGSKQNSIANFPSLATELFNKRLLRWLFPRRFPGKERKYSEPVEVDSVVGACMMVNREALDQVGVLDEDYFLFLEETDWCYRMKKAGWKIYHVPRAEVYHSQGKSAETVKKRAKIEYYRSRYHYFRKNKGPFERFILVTGLMIKLGVELVLVSAVCLVSFFAVEKWRRRLDLTAYLLWWHLQVCPKEMGLAGKPGDKSPNVI